MLYLKKDFSNVVLMSLLDRITNNTTGTISWSFLFHFVNDMTKESTTMITQLSGGSVSFYDSNDIYLKITDILSTPPSIINWAENGMIMLHPKGYWTYDVYEQNSLTNLDITDSSIIAKIETGKAYVYDDDDEVQYTEHIDTTNTTNYMYVK